MSAELPWYAGQLALPVISGLLSGVAGSMMWEGYLKPRRDQRALAAAMVAEIDDALNYVESLGDVVLRTGTIPVEFHVPTTLFDSLAGRVGELPPTVLRRVCSLYRQLHELNRVAGMFGSADMTVPPEDTWNVSSFQVLLRVVLQLGPHVRGELLRVAKLDRSKAFPSGPQGIIG